MNGMLEVDLLRAAFGVSVVLAAAAIAGAALGRTSQRVIYLISILIGVGATAAWVLFALEPETKLALPAAGMTAALLAAVTAIGVRRGVWHAARIEAEIRRAEARLSSIVARDAKERAAELERVLARARAESMSLI